MKSVQSKKVNLVLSAGDFLSPVIEAKLKRAAYCHKINLVVVTTNSGMVKEILTLGQYGNNEDDILKAVGRDGEVYIYTHNGWHGYTKTLARRLYERNKRVIVTVDGKIFDDMKEGEAKCYGR